MSTEQPPSFAALLRHYRRVTGLTQEELAARAGLSRAAIDTLERGTRRTPRKETVALLAAALALTPDDRATFAATARRAPAAALAATPAADAELNGQAADTRAEDGPDSAALAALGALPRGVVTFLFADVEGSTQLLHHLGSDRYAEVLAELQALLRAAWAGHAGHELGMQEDHLFVVFAYAEDALAASAAAQQALAAHEWPEGVRVRMRMGIHSGIALLTAGRYVGVEVHRAARIAAAGHGGQVIVSQAVVEQVKKFGYRLPDGTRLQDVGEHRLPGLEHREHLAQLVLPGLQTDFPPLRTLNAWRGVRANLVVVSALTLVLLMLAGLVLPLVVPTFPRALGLVAGGVAIVLLAAGGVAVLLRRSGHARGAASWSQAWTLSLTGLWRDARKGMATVVSVLLSAVVVLTTLFITKPTLLSASGPGGYDFSYTAHPPTRTGGDVVIGTGLPIHSLAPSILTDLPDQVYRAVWDACVVQLPDLTLPYIKRFRPDQCTQVPTIANGDESGDYQTTTFRIDPRAVWSDGQPITAADFLFAFRLVTDTNIHGNVWLCGCPTIYPPWNLMHHLTALDEHTVRIDWTVANGDYLRALAQLTPLPLHVYAQGPYTGVYDAKTDAYNSALAQRMAAQDSFNLHILVDNGPFLVDLDHVEGYPGVYQANAIGTAQRLVLARNPRFFSNFFHHPAALDHVTFQTKWAIDLPDRPERRLAARDALLAAYQQGGLTVDDMVAPLDLGNLEGIPTGEVVSSPVPTIITMGFNQRDVAPSARANGGESLFADRTLRQAFVEAFDRCGALKAELGLRVCTDPNFHTDEHAAPPTPDYDATVTLPRYNPSDAARLLERAGYHDVGGVRRYKDGTTPLELLVSLSYGGTPYLGLAQRLQQDYDRNLHIAVHILTGKNGSSNTLFGGVDVTGAFDIGVWRQDVGPDPVDNLDGSTWDTAHIPSTQNPSGDNFLGIIDPWIVTQDKVATGTIGPDQQAEVYAQMVRHVTEQRDFLPLLIVADITLVKPTLCNFKKWPAYGAYVWNLADWYLARGPTCP